MAGGEQPMNRDIRKGYFVDWLTHQEVSCEIIREWFIFCRIRYGVIGLSGREYTAIKWIAKWRFYE